MRSRKRHIGRRVASVAVGAALLVVGLEAPAFAVLSATAVSPNSGPAGCVVSITGTDFNNPNVNSVVFLGAAAAGDEEDAIFQIRSATEIWATVPAGADNGPIRLTNTAAQTADTPAFTVANPGNCAPTITSFTPTCGPGGAGQAGTDVTITGTNLLDSSGGTLTGTTPPAAEGGDVRFAPYNAIANPVTGVAATPTSLTVNVPGGALDGPIKVTTFGALDGTGTATSTATFDAGTCITDFQPQSGDIGDTVTITGVGFQGATAVTFAGAGGTRVQAIFQLATDTETVDTITATVPVGAITGTIQVVAPGGTATTTADFTIGAGPGGPTHERSVTLRLRRHLVARGRVTVADDFAACADSVPVRIQRRARSGWRTVETTTTSSTGRYSERIRDRRGVYRAVAPRVVLDTAEGDVCLRDVSPRRRHRH